MTEAEADAAGVMDVAASQSGETSDLIVRWDEVRTGDLVLGYRGELDVATVLPQGHAWCPEGHVSICIGGTWHTPRKDRLTAVRRLVAGFSGGDQ